MDNKLKIFLNMLGYKTSEQELINLLNKQKDAVNNRFSEAMKSEDINAVKLTLFLIKESYDMNLSSLFDYIRREEEHMDAMLDLYKSLDESK